MVKIEILGTDCAKCKAMAKNVDKAIQELGVQVVVIKVGSIQAIMDRGVMMIPALYIDGKEVAIGKAPSVEEIKNLLKK